MVIGIFTESYQGEDVLAKECQQLEEQLTKNGHQVYIIQRGKHFKEEGNLLTVPLPGLFRFLDFRIAALSIGRVLKRLKKIPFDLIHIQEDSSISLLGEFLSAYLFLPLVYTYNPEYYDYSLSGNTVQRTLAKRNPMPGLRRLSNERATFIVKKRTDESYLRKNGFVDTPLFFVPFDAPDFLERIEYAYKQAQRQAI